MDTETLGQIIHRIANINPPSAPASPEVKAERGRLRKLSKDERLIGEATLLQPPLTLLVPSYHFPHEEARCQRCRDILWLQQGKDLVRCPDCQGDDIINARLRASGIPEVQNIKTLKSFRPNEHPKVREAYNATLRFLAEGGRPWLVMIGGAGCGKTHLSRAAGVALMSSGYPAKYFKEPDLADAMRATQAENSKVQLHEFIDRLVAVNTLILDDFGVTRHTDFTISEFERLLDRRYEARSKTIISSNLNQRQLSDISGRLVSRFLDRSMCAWVDMDGAPDYRLKP